MALSGIGVLIAMVLICVAILLTFDWNRAKPWLNARVSDATGRPFAINGDLALSWQRQGQYGGWRDWIPWPYLVAHELQLGNPDWMQAAAPGQPRTNMAELKELTFSLNPWALLQKKIVIPTLTLDGPTLVLVRDKDGKNNWTFQQNQASAWQLELQQLVLRKGAVQLTDAVRKLDLKADISTLEQSVDSYGIGWQASGSFNGAPVKGAGKAGAVLSLQNQTLPYPLQAEVQVGKTHIALQGTLTKPSQLAALDLRLKLAGASMAQLYPLTGIVLPETPPFATEGRLHGTLNSRGGDWIYEKFSGKMGSSDLAGTLEYRSKNPPDQPRPLLKGTVTSKLLQFADLAPLIGADSNASKARRDAPPLQPADKVLPVEPFKTERWDSIDADVQFSGNKILRGKNLPIDTLSTTLHLRDGVLALEPLNFGIAGGHLTSQIRLDGRGHPLKAQIKMSARHLKLKQLLPTLPQMKTSFGELNGDASLSGTGNSVATILGSSNGEVKALMDQGTISKFLLEEMGLNIGNVVLTKLFGDKQVEINCMASDFAVTDGLMQARTFIVDTAESSITVSGQVNLKQERLDLTINPENKRLRVITLRSPLYVRGSFKQPDVSVDKGVLALRAGGVVALGVVAPVAAALLPLIDLGPGKDSPCAKLLSEVSSKPQAPPPGKKYRAKTDKSAAAK
ncbi:AsmA family protein [Undibacterium arcticum]|uniref:AsmA family protein n=1 Tax=Undibacterium arcticum TaxID=1762892 RepID=UPI00360D23D2